MIDKLPQTSNRLKDLRKEHKISSQKKLVDKLNALWKEKFEKGTGDLLSLDMYKAYEQGRNLPNAKVLIALADFYNVSVDNVLGIIDYSTVSNKLVGEEYGLSDEALIGLKNIKLLEYAIMSDFVELHDKGIKRTYTGTPLSLLNFFLSSELFIGFLNDFLQYTFPIYKVPVFFDEQTEEWKTPKDKYSHFGDKNSVWNMHLAISSDKTEDNQGVQIDEHFLEGVAKYDMDKILNHLRKGYISSILNGLKKPSQWRIEDD